ncbi:MULTISPECIES: NUMOD4 motif-containing HNH endonuclease [unclassified Pseudomonas]|uniref:NUMOD4 motif-containing HNH endonuclease n=1 Tax=unclassified Pseudomonas TaxID=196821 RepID=UPI00244972C6|nr:MULTISPECIES: NUMOD4 motif-containing HNH endonuclease [unclassified Pseudomonas]MDG9926916.1 NUMOD4 motif-containing HNH endonuclease [Pseudomonas sp. GD04042]MDH0484633.1 NUMOD4 motif-containing HNH endonuclease [Pseudomonas sp. GD04015]MDH0602332.1 NUMOD4 motif-containing HNH endonuclease [Pseudomonas sp. GD03869]
MRSNAVRPRERLREGVAVGEQDFQIGSTCANCARFGGRMKLISARQAWRPAAGFEETHEVSREGQIRSLGRVLIDSAGRRRMIPGKLSQPTKKTNGYMHVTLNADGKQKTLHVHRIVLEAFEGACPEGMEALHRNGVKSDNRLDNLRWGTHLENCVDRSKHGGTGTLLNFELAQQIRAMCGKATQVEIARQFGVSQFMVGQILMGRYWNVPPEDSPCD